MSVVWKYQLDVQQNQLVFMPADAQILSVGVQNDFPVIWVITNGKGVPLKDRIFSVVTTGETFEGSDVGDLHIGTVVLGKDMASGNPSAWYVAHIFACWITVGDEKLDDRRELQRELGPSVQPT